MGVVIVFVCKNVAQFTVKKRRRLLQKIVKQERKYFISSKTAIHNEAIFILYAEIKQM